MTVTSSRAEVRTFYLEHAQSAEQTTAKSTKRECKNRSQVAATKFTENLRQPAVETRSPPVTEDKQRKLGETCPKTS